MGSVMKTLFLALIAAGATLTVFWELRADQQRAAMRELQALNERLGEQVSEREEMIRRLSRSRRIARITIDDQTHKPDGSVETTMLTMIELDERGSELDRQSFVVPGDIVFFDAWTAKFDHESVAGGDPLAGRTLVLLRRVYSDAMPPRDGYPIDLPGAIPAGYASTEAGRFEQQIWRHFWRIAGDQEYAADLGVRVAQGEVVYQRVRTGQEFVLEVDAAGGMNLRTRPQLSQAEPTAP
jgi:hypothetical protein